MMTISETGFQCLEKKVEDIQSRVDQGLSFGGESGAVALTALRNARVELFELRSLLREQITISQQDPCDPDAA